MPDIVVWLKLQDANIMKQEICHDKIFQLQCWLRELESEYVTLSKKILEKIDDKGEETK